MLHRGLHVWSLKRYCVTVSDNWTPLRLFWTLEGAKNFYKQHRSYSNVFKWNDGEWQWMCGARDEYNWLDSKMAAIKSERKR
jgi:hypothetical protein